MPPGDGPGDFQAFAGAPRPRFARATCRVRNYNGRRLERIMGRARLERSRERAVAKETPMRKRCALLLGPLLLAACDGNPTAPDSPAVQSVAGSYSGTVSIGGIICATTTSVTQNGSYVAIAPLQVGECINAPTNSFVSSFGLSSIPLSQTTIDETGRFGQVSGTLPNDHCAYSYYGTGGLSRDLRISFTHHRHRQRHSKKTSCRRTGATIFGSPSTSRGNSPNNWLTATGDSRRSPWLRSGRSRW